VLTTGRPRAGWAVFLVAVIPFAVVFATGVALIFARAGRAFLDVKQLTPLLFRILFYVSGILFPVQAFLSEHPLLGYLPLNPIYAFVTLARHYTLAPQPHLLTNWASAIVWAALTAISGLVIFSRAEYRYGRD
jgi:teichoic acid transport system permease protein